MQLIRLGETTAALIEIPFTSVLASNLQTRISGVTLANASITVRIKKGGVASAVTGGAGAFTATDDTNALGVRGYRPSSGELVLGISTFIFTGANMEPREVPVMIVPWDPYASDQGLLAATVEGSITIGRALRGLTRMLFGAKRAGYDTGTVVVRDVADTKNSMTVTTTAQGWTAVTLTDLD